LGIRKVDDADQEDDLSGGHDAKTIQRTIFALPESVPSIAFEAPHEEQQYY
jgi:hypothetical protein